MSALAGRVAVVTGAARGIGAAIASRLAGEGAVVVRLDLTLRAARPERGLDLPCDIADEADVNHAASRVLGEFGAPDLIVSNAGLFRRIPFEKTGAREFDEHHAVNARGPFLVARAFLPAMREAGRGHHVAIGSVADHRALPGNAAYASAKHALRGLHRVLRREYRGTGLRFTLVSPGPVDTAAWDAIDPDHQPGLVPRRRMLQAEDVADAVCWIVTRPPRVDIDWIRLGPA